MSVIAPLLRGPLDGLQAAPAGGRAFSIWEALQAMGLAGHAVFAHDHGAVASDPGAGQRIRDLSGRGFDFALGADLTASTDDPVFRGVPGGLDKNTYRGHDGGDSHAALANNAAIDAMHKAAALYTLVFYLEFPNFATLQVLAATSRITSDVGIRHLVGTSGQLSIAINNGGGTFQAQLASSITLTANVPSVVVIAIDEDGGAGASHARINTLVEAFDGVITAPSSAAAARTLRIGGNDIGTQNFVNGTRLYARAMLDVAMTQAESGDLMRLLSARTAA